MGYSLQCITHLGATMGYSLQCITHLGATMGYSLQCITPLGATMGYSLQCIILDCSCLSVPFWMLGFGCINENYLLSLN